MSALPTATYRVQLREGVDFDAVRARVGYLAELGVSHLYLSPIFTAAGGSTHGYDVTDPAAIDPVLGGRAGFEALSRAARAAGLGVILDIVPNHTAFTVENPWLRDVLRHGARSRFADHFDIDWSAGRLVLPWLSDPFETLLARGALRIEDGDDGPAMTDGAVAAPLAPDTAPDRGLWRDADAIRAAHEAQAWRLAHWEIERDGVTHRRFFNVTGLIGMRVEDPAVFDAMHALPLTLLREGLADGLRVDHVDGVADPTGYLRRLRAAVGDAPIWVEKILVGDEDLPDWPVTGTTGYEAGRAIARLLTDGAGLDRLWRAETDREGDFHDVLTAAKREALRLELAAELHKLIALGRAAAEAAPEIEAGEEGLREAVIALLVAFPRYRSYFAGAPDARDGGRAEDRALMAAVTDEAAEGLRSDRILRFLAGLVTDADTPQAVAFRTRFQQTTGALLAKSHEDTAAFRHTRYLAACEVGAEPDEAVLDAAGFQAWAQARGPGGMTFTSSHDSKRSEDSRARLIALSRQPETFARLWRATPGAADVPADLRWYILQSLLAIWEPGCADLADRLAAHVEKAMREAKETTSWTHPAAEPEAAAQGFARALADRWGKAPPEPALALIAQGEALALCQLALKMTLPGIPDIYQGCEGPFFALTDPDNRRRVDWKALARLRDADGFAGRKARLTATLARLRRAAPQFFARAETRLAAEKDGGWTLTRSEGATTLSLRLRPEGGEAGGGALWPRESRDEGACVAIDGARDLGALAGDARPQDATV
jgi:(1->4)-alpha-D-glucan 1-alpha-D-glucosylmutase